MIVEIHWIAEVVVTSDDYFGDPFLAHTRVRIAEAAAKAAESVWGKEAPESSWLRHSAEAQRH